MSTGPIRFAVAALACAGAAASSAAAQQLLDRVVARVNGAPVFLSDVRAAAGFGMVESGTEADQARQLVRRQVVLGEVSRFPPPEPDPADVAAEVARMKGRVRDAAAFEREHGLSDQQVRSMARDTLRIEAYLVQRFGASRQRDAVEQWMKDLEARADVVFSRSP
jgi:parvulin-like peptidyl-prolyl isomerase